MNFKRKILAALTAIALGATAMPLAAFAADEDAAEEIVTEEGAEKAVTLSEDTAENEEITEAAVELFDTTSLATSGNITLDDEVTLSANHTLAGDTTIELNGHTIDLGSAYIDVGSHSLTINDSTGGGVIKSTGQYTIYSASAGSVTVNAGMVSNSYSGTSQESYCIYFTNGGTINITGGTVSAVSYSTYTVTTSYTYTTAYAVYAEGADVTLSGGTVSVSYDENRTTGMTAISYGIYVTYYGSSDGSVTMTGGEIISTGSRSAYGIYENSGTTNISGGTITVINVGTYSTYGVYQNGGTLNMYDGTISVTSTVTNSNSHAGIYAGSSADINIFGGAVEVSGYNNIYAIYLYNAGTTTVTDGTFTAEASTGNAYVVNVYGEGELEISGGTFTATTASTSSNTGIALYFKATSGKYITADISAGTFSGTNGTPSYLSIYNGSSTTYQTNVTVTLSGGTYNSDVKNLSYVEIAETYYQIDNSDGTYTISRNYADNVVLSLEEMTDSEDETIDGVYYIVLSAADNTNGSACIYRFLSAQLKFAFDEDDGNGTDYDITKIGALTVSEYTDDTLDYGVDVLYEGDGEYVFKAKSDDSSVDTITATSIILGVATIEGVGSYSLNVDTTYDTNQAPAAESANNIVSDFYYTTDTAVTSGKLILDDSTYNSTDATIPATGEVNLTATTLTINVVFPNAVTAQSYNYTAMHISVDGLQVYGEDADAYEIDLGNDNSEELTNQTITYYTDSAKSDTATLTYTGYTVTVPVYVNYGYSLKFTGDGYRTCNTSIIPTGDDASVTVWNNVMDSEYTIVTVNDDEEKTADVTFLAGDICGNGVIDLYDLSAVVSYFGKADIVGTETYDTYNDYDLNRDGKIDSKDIAMVLVSWGK